MVRNIKYGLGFLGALALGGVGGSFFGRHQERLAVNEQRQEIITKAYDRLANTYVPDLHKTNKRIAILENYMLGGATVMYGKEFAATAQEAHKEGNLENFLVTTAFSGQLPKPNVRDASFEETLTEYHRLRRHQRGLESLAGRYGAMITGAEHVWDDKNMYVGTVIENHKKTLPEGYR